MSELQKHNIGNETLSDNVYEKLKDEILNIEIKPGNILTENDISGKYDISRSTVRSVFQKLKDDGLITAIPYKLSYVSQLDMNTILEVIYMRIAVESMIMRDFIDLDDKKSIKKLERNVEDQSELLKQEKVDYKEFAKLDSEFHRIIFESLDKLEVWNLIQRAELSYFRFKILDLFAMEEFSVIYKNHEELLNIVHDKRISDIESEYKRHLYSGIKRLRNKVFTEFMDYFTEGTDEKCIKNIDILLKEVYEN